MAVGGLIRERSGIDLLVDGDKIEIIDPVKASITDLKVVGWCLVVVSILLISSAITVTIRKYVSCYIYCWISLLVFLISGIVNSFLLYRSFFTPEQWIDWGICFVVALFLILGKDRIKSKYIQDSEYR